MENHLIFKLPFETNLNDSDIKLKTSFQNCVKINKKFTNFNLKILYSKQYSIKDLFINHFKLSINSYSF